MAKKRQKRLAPNGFLGDFYGIQGVNRLKKIKSLWSGSHQERITGL